MWYILILLIIVLFVFWRILGPGPQRMRPGTRPQQPSKPDGSAPAPPVSSPSPAQPSPPDQVDEPVPIEETPPTPDPTEPPAEPDDLRKLEGIGPKVQSILNEAGIYTFAQLAATEHSRLRAILDENGLKFMKPESWPEQAAFAQAGDWDGLNAYQATLTAGRKPKE